MGFITEGLNCAGIGFMSRLFSDQKLTGFHTSRLVPLINYSLTTVYIYIYVQGASGIDARFLKLSPA
jgi:hypothetical protein